MTTYKVLEHFKGVLEEMMKNVRLQTKESEMKKPDVVLGYLEPLKVDEDEKDDFPYVIVRYTGGDSSEDESEIAVKLIFGVYSQDVKGWVDILHMVEVVKKELLSKRVFDYYMLEGSIKTTMPEEQPYPYFYGFLDVKFKIPHIEYVREGDEEHWNS